MQAKNEWKKIRVPKSNAGDWIMLCAYIFGMMIALGMMVFSTSIEDTKTLLLGAGGVWLFFGLIHSLNLFVRGKAVDNKLWCAIAVCVIALSLVGFCVGYIGIGRNNAKYFFGGLIIFVLPSLLEYVFTIKFCVAHTFAVLYNDLVDKGVFLEMQRRKKAAMERRLEAKKENNLRKARKNGLIEEEPKGEKIDIHQTLPVKVPIPQPITAFETNTPTSVKEETSQRKNEEPFWDDLQSDGRRIQ